MKLNRKSLENKEFFEKAGIKIPSYDLAKLETETKANPKWVHFGGGNIFRVFVANALDKAIEEGRANTGIIVAETFDFEVVDRVFAETDNLSLSAITYSNGDINLKVIGSMVEAVKATGEGISRLEEIFTNKDFQMASFTITEKGYALKNMDGEYLGIVAEDMKNGLTAPKHVMSIVTSLLYKRFKACDTPVAIVSMDNCSHNGDKVKAAVVDIANTWCKNGFVEEGFVNYIATKVSFPFSMIDKITPRPADEIVELLTSKGLEGMEVIKTEKNTFTAHFVNAESAEYLIIEDDFPNGKPDFANDRVIFTTREIVNNVETMKVTTCLNPLHTALAVNGVLLNHKTIADEMQDTELKKLVERIGYTEGLKVVINPGIIDPKAFIDEVINERFSNSFIIDTPERIATDTSQKVGIRFGNTIKAYVADESLNTKDLVGIPLALASWLRYLLAVDDKGNAFEPSTDPLLAELQEVLKGIKLGDSGVKLDKILSNKDIFGLDLTTIELGARVEAYFNEMIAEVGAVRATLKKYL